MRTFPFVMLSTTGVSGIVSSSALGITYTTGYSCQAVYTGGISGTLSLGASNDGINFSTIKDSPQAISGSGNFMYNVRFSNYDFVNATFSATPPSSGTLVINFFSKGP